MTAFDKAWALLKMPLDYDSIEQVGEKKYNANFIHPDTGEVYPMVASDFGLGYESGIYEPGQRPELTQGSVLSDNPLSHLVMTGGDRDFAWGAGTKPSHRGKGMASALYDMVANIRDQEGEGAVIVPSDDRSRGGKGLWERYEEEGHWPRSQDEKEQMMNRESERERERELAVNDIRSFRRNQRLRRRFGDD